jgi:phosphoribosyl-AMP cyclohydrolase
MGCAGPGARDRTGKGHGRRDDVRLDEPRGPGRNKLWFKGEESGHVQTVHEVRIDCDNDVVLLKITQTGHEPGIACHTGRHSCFYSVLRDGQWQAVDPVLKDPESI